jgi:hypothetical protein
LEAIAGHSVMAFRRCENEEGPPAKDFGLVRSYQQRQRRLWEVRKSVGMPEISQ